MAKCGYRTASGLNGRKTCRADRRRNGGGRGSAARIPQSGTSLAHGTDAPVPRGPGRSAAGPFPRTVRCGVRLRRLRHGSPAGRQRRGGGGLSRHGSLLVVCSGRTDYRQAQKAKQSLERAGACVLGAILGDVKMKGKEHVRSARLKQTGEMRLASGKWVPFEGEEYCAVDPPGFVWVGRVKMAPLLSALPGIPTLPARGAC